MPKTISYSEAQRKFKQMTEEVESRGVSYTILKNGKEVAFVNPFDSQFEQDLRDFEEQYKEVLTEPAKK